MNGFELVLDSNGSSPNPQTSIWLGQHVCVSENSRLGLLPSESECGNIIVKHQLKVLAP